MSRKRMLWQLFPSYLLIILFAVIILTWYAVEEQAKFHMDQVEADLEVRAHLVADQLESSLLAGDVEGIDELCVRLGTRVDTRITVILPSGEVVGESEKDPAEMESHRDRPEIARALTGVTGMSTRYSNTLQQTMMYVAIPLMTGDSTYAVVRTSVPITFISEAKGVIFTRMILGGVAIAVLAALVSLLVSRRLSRPLEELRRGAQRFARGELTAKIGVPDSEEMGALAEAMNSMAEQLDDRISTVTSQRNERMAILSSMVEGLLAVDTEERIITVNSAAGRFFGVDPDGVVGRVLHEAIRNPSLHQLVSNILRNRAGMEAEITVPGDRERHLQASGSVLNDAGGEAIGAVVVLNDVTRIRQLETMRRDFVANVSHELRTPITSIKGFAETLLESQNINGEESHRFLTIIAKHADRLNLIIDDLLSLSRIEQAPEVEYEESDLAETLRAVVNDSEGIARARAIVLRSEFASGLKIRMNRQLIEQAVGNLVDNAVKYSDPGSQVTVRADRADGESRISVVDSGSGIEPRHLERIFERFYRVDKSRSREEGGTGLGLAIVKHIALAHGGRVSVESSPGQGSTFTIHLPLDRSVS